MPTTISTPKGMPLGAQVIRYGECVEDIFKYAEYVKVQNETTSQIEQMVLYKHQRLLLLSLMYYKLVALIKARQLGCSVAAGLYHLWKCHRPVTKILCLSAGQREASSLLDKSRFINENVPTWLRLKVGSDGQELMTFPDTRSQILALPSTMKAGVGESASHITRDELDWHDYAELNYGNIKPTIDRGASDLAMSAPDRTKPASHLKTLYTKGKVGENRYHPMLFPWYCHPERDMKWYLETQKDYNLRWMFEQDYFTTEAEAVGTVEGEGLFDRAKIAFMLRQTVRPLEERGSGVFIFHRANPEVHYYAGADCAEGKGGDYQCLWIEGEYRMQRFLAAIIHTNKAEPDIFANLSIQLLQEYHRPLLVCGNDAWGLMYLKYLERLGYGTQIHCSNPDKLGYNEQELKFQFNVLLLKFSKAVTDGLIIEYKPALEEMMSYNLSGGKFVSTAPHDDAVCAAKLANLARDLQPVGGDVEQENFY